MDQTCEKAQLPVEAIPACLRDLPQWVCWEYVSGEGKPAKVPICPRSGFRAKSSDRTSWATFEEAVAAYQRVPRYAGIGFVFTDEDPYCGIDLDDCLDERDDFLWGRALVRRFACYTEISPSGRGVKLVFRGRKPDGARCQARTDREAGCGRIEIYDRNRFFVITGRTIDDPPGEVADRQEELDRLCEELWPPRPEPAILPVPLAANPADVERRAVAYLAAMQPAVSSQRGHGATYAAATALVHGFGIEPERALHLLLEHYNPRCQPPWPVKDLEHKIRSAVEKPHKRPFGWLRDADAGNLHGVDLSAFRVAGHRLGVRRDAQPAGIAGGAAAPVPEPVTVHQLLREHPSLRPPVIEGLLRQGETMNVIAPSKVGKSWLVTDLALCLAAGRPWLESFQTVAGNVLIVDNELHAETSSNRIPKVAAARGIAIEEIGERVFVVSLRGRLKDIVALGDYFLELEPGRYQVIILDAFYRFLPPGTDENDNGAMAQIYNLLDLCADRLASSFVLVHHSSKGNQAGKSVTDVGAGAGSQSRATDTHVILRPHELPEVVVLEAAVRSWPPIEPICLQRVFPLWVPAPGLDPTALRSERPRRRAAASDSAPAPSAPPWNARRFAEQFVQEAPRPRMAILEYAINAGLSERQAGNLLARAEAVGLVHRWDSGDRRSASFATVRPPDRVEDEAPAESGGVKRDRVVRLLLAEPLLKSAEVASRCGADVSYVRRIRKDLEESA
jgi:hypothetical protein